MDATHDAPPPPRFAVASLPMSPLRRVLPTLVLGLVVAGALATLGATNRAWWLVGVALAGFVAFAAPAAAARFVSLCDALIPP